MLTQNRPRPNIPASLLWEFDYDTFSFDRSYKIVIERVLQLVSQEEWKEMVKYYSQKQILETIEWSAQMDKRDKDFALLFLKSDALHSV